MKVDSEEEEDDEDYHKKNKKKRFKSDFIIDEAEVRFVNDLLPQNTQYLLFKRTKINIWNQQLNFICTE